MGVRFINNATVIPNQPDEYQDHVAWNGENFTSPWYGKARHNAHIDAAAVSQAAFDAAWMQTAPAWYSPLPAQVKAILRECDCREDVYCTIACF